MVVSIRANTEARNRDESVSYAKNSGQFKQSQANLGVDGPPMSMSTREAVKIHIIMVKLMRLHLNSNSESNCLHRALTWP